MRAHFAAIFASLAVTLVAASAILGTPATDAVATGDGPAPSGPPALPETAFELTDVAADPLDGPDDHFPELVPFVTEDADIQLLEDGELGVGAR